jgi:multiple sugar transport system permease protein
MVRTIKATSARFRGDAGALARHLLLLIGAAAMIAPFLWMVTTSLKTGSEVFKPPYLLPGTFHWENYVRAWEAAPFALYYLNSLVMTLAIVAGHVLFDAMAAYAFARLRFPGRNLLFLLFLGTMMVPIYVTIIPAYTLVSWLGWIDTYQALIVPRLVDVFGIVLLRQYFLTIPVELEEAALIDGASKFTVLWRIVFPLARPALATLSVFSFLFAWNDFLWPLLVTNSDSLRTIQVGLAAFQGRYGTQWNYLMAGTVTATLPGIAVFLFAQRALIRGIALTGLKE